MLVNVADKAVGMTGLLLQKMLETFLVTTLNCDVHARNKESHNTAENNDVLTDDLRRHV